MGMDEEEKEHKETLMAQVDVTIQHGMASSCVGRLR